MRSKIRHSGMQFCPGHTCNYLHIVCKEIEHELGGIQLLRSTVIHSMEEQEKEDILYINAGQAKRRNKSMYLCVSEGEWVNFISHMCA